MRISQKFESPIVRTQKCQLLTAMATGRKTSKECMSQAVIFSMHFLYFNLVQYNTGKTTTCSLNSEICCQKRCSLQSDFDDQRINCKLTT